MGLNLSELIHLARQHNPDLQEITNRWQALQFEALSVTALPDPKLSGGFKNMEFGRFSLGAEPMSAVAIMFEQEIPFPGKLALKGALTTQEAQMLWQNYRMKTQTIITELKRNYYDLYHVYKALRVLHTNQQILEKFLKTVEIKYSVGQSIQQDLLKAQVEMTMLGEQRLMWEQKKQAIAVNINRLVGRSSETPVGEPMVLPDKLWGLSFATLQQQILRVSPELQEQKLQTQTQQLKLEQIKQEYLPDFMLSGGYMNRGVLSPMWELMIGINLPIYAGQKQNYMWLAAQQNLAAAESRDQRLRQDLTAKLKSLLLMVETEQKLKHLYERDLLPQARQTLDASLASYMVGKADFLTILENLNILLAYELATHEKNVNAYKALAEIEDMTVADLEPETPATTP